MADETQTLSDLGELAEATGMTPEAAAETAESARTRWPASGSSRAAAR